MNVRIHRGAHEVGGTCIEVESAGARIVLDVDQPLDADPAIPTPLPDVAGFRSADPSLLGILISHGHQDHWGLIGQVPSQVPVFVGAATSRILKEAAFFSTGIVLNPAASFSIGCRSPAVRGGSRP